MSKDIRVLYPTKEELRDMVARELRAGVNYPGFVVSRTPLGIEVDGDVLVDRVMTLLDILDRARAESPEVARLRARTHEIAEAKDKEISRLARKVRQYESAIEKVRQFVNEQGIISPDKWDGLSWEARVTGHVVAKAFATQAAKLHDTLREVLGHVEYVGEKSRVHEYLPFSETLRVRERYQEAVRALKEILA